MKFYLVYLITLFYTGVTIGQITFFQQTPDSLIQNANAVVKNYKISLEIIDFNKYKLNKYKLVTVFNKQGLESIDTHEIYDKSTSIKNVEIVIYDLIGNEIKKVRKRDFQDISLSQGSIITDNRVIYYDYIPVEYPFTILYKSEVISSNTAFLPSWVPISDYNISLVHGEYTVKNINNHKLKYKVLNNESEILNSKIIEYEDDTQVKFNLDNVKALKREVFAPNFNKIFPKVILSLEEFELENIKGSTKSWKEFGSWMYNSFLSDTEEISQETLLKISNLIKDEVEDEKKARIIYEYVQNNTRYVSIQLGIGGWKPMKASQVDKLGYGDCKALTNYTRSLLKAFNIKSYYTIVYGDRNKKDLVTDFVSMQGNHVILGIPQSNEIIWLECTSQDIPFGFQGNFTDDRSVLIIDDENSKITRTKKYDGDINKEITTGTYKILENGDFISNIEIKSHGLNYLKYRNIINVSDKDKKEYYFSKFEGLKNLKIESLSYDNDKINVTFVEKINIKANDFVEKYGNDLVFSFNAFNKYQNKIRKNSNRTLPFEIERGYYEEDIVDIEIPQDYKIQNLPSEIKISSKFGYYNLIFLQKSESIISYHRKLLIKEGYYEKNMFNNYQEFVEEIIKSDNLKILINK